MSEQLKDPAIKLFGKSITLPPHQPSSSDREIIIIIPPITPPAGKTDDGDGVKDSSKKDSSTDDDDDDESNQKKKSPDKIIPCQRCNSMETKFCYYNNYNINQPRHFCKKCQRYWTAGGNMRNVPVGSGRRKNKNIPPFSSSSSSLHYPPILIRPPDSCSSTNSPPDILHPFWGSSNYSTTINHLALALGKHSRDQVLEMISPPDDSEKKRICIPKTMRIHDPIEAATSSIWSTLGIIHDPTINRNREGGRLKGLQGEENCSSSSRVELVLEANPAAMIRSVRFHESSVRD